MSLKSVILVGIPLTVLLTSCTASRAEQVGSKSRLPERDIPTARASQEPLVPEAAPAIEPVGTIALPQALALALARNPALAAFSREIRAREGLVLQARLLPNPELGVTAENFGNSRLQGLDGPATTVSLSQLILLGGKRAKAIRVTQLDQDLAVWDYEAKRLDILTQVVQAFVEMLQAQEGLALADDLLRLTGQVVEAVSARVRAGKVSPVEETRARVSLASVEVERKRAQRELEAARKRLAATWGSTAPRFETAVGRLDGVRPIHSLEALLDRLEQNPDLARWASEITQRQASIDLERSRAIPDAIVSLGMRQFINTNDSALVAGVSIPLPVLNRNQGNIQAAHQRLTRAMEERRATEVLVTTALNTVYQRLATAHAEVTTLKAEVLPGAKRAFEAVSRGYRLGKFSLLDVLDAQRTLFGAKAQYLQALASYHQAVAEVERLIGEPVEAARSLEEPR